MKTSIEWTDRSINPIRARDPKTGAVGHFCVKISPGCKRCYASRMQRRFRMHEFVVTNRDKVELFFDDSKLFEVLRRREPSKWFWCDMTDMFGDWVPDEWIDWCVVAMALSLRHTHQVLTKRIERALAYFSRFKSAKEAADYYGRVACNLFGEEADCAVANSIEGCFGEAVSVGWPLGNLWLGTSCENQQEADKRIPYLLNTPAAVRFISAEPLLGPISLVHDDGNYVVNLLQGSRSMPDCDDPKWDHFGKLDWVICGGESGPGARAMHSDWARSLRDQCVAAGVAFHFKQWGEYGLYDAQKDSHIAREDQTICVFPDGSIQSHAEAFSMHADKPWWMLRVGKKAAGRDLDGRTWDEFPHRAGRDSNGQDHRATAD